VHHRRFFAIALAACLLFTAQVGCIGQMATSGLVRKFNLDVVENKWGREAVFLLLHFIPAYPIAGAIDLIIVNSIEFHTGTNPITDKPRIALLEGHEEQVAPDGSRATSQLNEDGSVTIEAVDVEGDRHTLRLVPTAGAIEVRDGDDLLYGRVEASQVGDAVYATLPTPPRG
jgi:hypothetical protein